MIIPESLLPDQPWIRSLAEARLNPHSFFYLDCENEIPVTSPIRHVKCSEQALQQLSDDLGLYGPLTDSTHCIFFDASPNQRAWSKEQLSDNVWVAPEYDSLLGPAIRRLLSGEADDIYNDCFDPTAHFFSDFPTPGVGTTPMYLAALSGDWDGTFTRMLRCSKNINVRNTDGDTPLHGAAKRGHVEFVERLLNFGADIDAKGASDMTPLHLAILNQNWRVPPPL